MISLQDMDTLLQNLEKNNPLIYTYINEFKDDEEKNNLVDFQLFNYEEREIILKILSHQNKKISDLKNYQTNTKDKILPILKYIMLSEKDKSLNDIKFSDIRFYFRIIHTLNKILLNFLFMNKLLYYMIFFVVKKFWIIILYIMNKWYVYFWENILKYYLIFAQGKIVILISRKN